MRCEQSLARNVASIYLNALKADYRIVSTDSRRQIQVANLDSLREFSLKLETSLLEKILAYDRKL